MKEAEQRKHKQKKNIRTEQNRTKQPEVCPNRKHCVQIKLTEEMRTSIAESYLGRMVCLYCSPSLATFNFNWINLKIDVYFTYLLHTALCSLYILVRFFYTHTHTLIANLKRFLSKSVWTNEFLFLLKKRHTKSNKRANILAIICDTVAVQYPSLMSLIYVSRGFLLYFVFCVTISNKMLFSRIANALDVCRVKLYTKLYKNII